MPAILGGTSFLLQILIPVLTPANSRSLLARIISGASPFFLLPLTLVMAVMVMMMMLMFMTFSFQPSTTFSSRRRMPILAP
jgi:cytochrome c biogenesis factor